MAHFSQRLRYEDRSDTRELQRCLAQSFSRHGEIHSLPMLHHHQHQDVVLSCTVC